MTQILEGTSEDVTADYDELRRQIIAQQIKQIKRNLMLTGIALVAVVATAVAVTIIMSEDEESEGENEDN